MCSEEDTNDRRKAIAKKGDVPPRSLNSSAMTPTDRPLALGQGSDDCGRHLPRRVLRFFGGVFGVDQRELAMLPSNTVCHRASRRETLRIGGLGMLGLSLPQFLEGEQQATHRPRAKSIFFYQHTELLRSWRRSIQNQKLPTKCVASSEPSTRRLPASESANGCRRSLACATG